MEGGKECAVEFVWLLAESTEAPTWIDMCFAWTVTIGRARQNKLFFRAEDVSQPFVTHNPELLELVAPQLQNDARPKCERVHDGMAL